MAIENRREFLKQGLGALAGAATASVVNPSLLRAGESTPDYVMIIDLNKCNGCQSCVIACKAGNRTAPNSFLTRVNEVESDRYPHPRLSFVPTLCNQCEDPPCVKACPQKATYKIDSGIVVTDWNRCTGAGTCVSACPYGARLLDPRHGNKADKCDFCRGRLARNLLPVCVENCPPGARVFGDRSRPVGAFAEYLRRGDLESAKPELGIRTRVLYVPRRRS